MGQAIRRPHEPRGDAHVPATGKDPSVGRVVLRVRSNPRRHCGGPARGRSVRPCVYRSARQLCRHATGTAGTRRGVFRRGHYFRLPHTHPAFLVLLRTIRPLYGIRCRLPCRHLYHLRVTALGHEHESGTQRRVGCSGQAVAVLLDLRHRAGARHAHRRGDLPRATWRAPCALREVVTSTQCAMHSLRIRTACRSRGPDAFLLGFLERQTMNVPQYDAIVVGSGAGGAAAAYRLVSGGMRVLLLEKGAHLPRDGSTLDVRRVVHDGEYFSREPWLDGHGNSITPEEHFNVGGKTKWYGAALLRFSTREFLPETAYACLGWPISLNDLTPYYEQAERLLGVRPFACEPDLAAILARLQAAGSAWQSSAMPMGLSADIVNHPNEAAHFDGFASVKSLKGEAETSLLSQLQARTNFTLLPDAEVDALLGHPGSPATVSGVRLRDGRIFYAPRILLAAGALHSPRLLSRYLSETGLGSVLPVAALVGRYVKLHLLTAMVSVSLGVNAA